MLKVKKLNNNNDEIRLQYEEELKRHYKSL